MGQTEWPKQHVEDHRGLTKRGLVSLYHYKTGEPFVLKPVPPTGTLS